ncbi:MAG: 3-oxoadipate enol-lactonase [Micromonosporaceae bacterium]|nr:3-oxoadipate enol-lactonase [Micromonosporaceae bacterium]
MAKLQHEEFGPAGGPVLVLGGSLGTALRMWRPQVEALADRYRIICYDHRGHGGSQVPPGPYTMDDLGGDVLALLDGLGVDSFAYCGLSLGGMVGMWLAAHQPGRVRRLVLLCTAAHLPPAQGWLERAARVRGAGITSIADTVLARWFTAAMPGTDPRVAWCREMLLATPAEGYAGCCEAIAMMDLRPELVRIAAPTLVVAGALDPATPPTFAGQIAAAVPAARLTILPDAAHLSNVECPDSVSGLLTEHLESTDG